MIVGTFDGTKQQTDLAVKVLYSQYEGEMTLKVIQRSSRHLFGFNRPDLPTFALGHGPHHSRV